MSPTLAFVRDGPVFVYRIHRDGLTVCTDIWRDGALVYETCDAFTSRGARRRGEELVAKLRSGMTVDDLAADDDLAKTAW